MLHINMNNSILTSIRIKRAEYLRSTRIESNITKSDLSRKSGLSRKCIDRIESGIKPWNVDSELIYIETLNKSSL